MLFRSMRSMVIFMHIDYNNGCTRVFRMRLMVIDVCIDETLLFLGQFALKTVISEVSGQLSVVSSQKPWPPTPSPLDRLLYPPCACSPLPQVYKLRAKRSAIGRPQFNPFRRVQGGGTPWARGSGGNRHSPGRRIVIKSSNARS